MSLIRPLSRFLTSILLSRAKKLGAPKTTILLGINAFSWYDTVMPSASTVSYTGSYAFGERSSGLGESSSETALVELGTRRQIWQCPCLSQFWITAVLEW
jgi:hypothetical protein